MDIFLGSLFQVSFLRVGAPQPQPSLELTGFAEFHRVAQFTWFVEIKPELEVGSGGEIIGQRAVPTRGAAPAAGALFQADLPPPAWGGLHCCLHPLLGSGRCGCFWLAGPASHPRAGAGLSSGRA